MSSDLQNGQFIRLSETERPEITICVDGVAVRALSGDTVRLREFEFGPGWRAGFCLMGACQDCWVLQENGGTIRACTSYVAEGMRLLTGGDAE